MPGLTGSYGSGSLVNHDYGMQYLTRQNFQDSNPNSADRPSNLEVVSRLRSSLKRSNYAYSSPNKSSSKNNSGSGESYKKLFGQINPDGSNLIHTLVSSFEYSQRTYRYFIEFLKFIWCKNKSYMDYITVYRDRFSRWLSVRSSSKMSFRCSGTPTNPTPPDSLTSEDSSYVSAKDSQISLGRVRFSPVTFDREVLVPHPQTPEITSPLQASRRIGNRNRKPSITELEREFLS